MSETVSVDTAKNGILCNHTCMNKTQNPYAQQILAKGRDLPTATKSDRKVPARFADRFATYEEYQEAMADFLNGMWQSTRCHITACNCLQNLQQYIQDQKTQKMATPIFSISPEMQQSWDDLMGQMIAFVNDTNADVDMAYDWVCEMLNIDSFVDNETAWNSFYDVWESCDNRNDRPFFHEYNFAWYEHLLWNP